MHYFIKGILILVACLFTYAKLAAESEHVSVVVKGGGTFISPNSFSQGFNVNVTKFDIKARGNRLIKGTFKVSSNKAAPVDPVTGVDFEVDSSFVDAIRVFATHPDIVWVHGFTKKGSIRLGTDLAPPFGEFIVLNEANGEFIGAVTTWGRTNFLTVAENNNEPLPNFFSLTETELIELVGGFSRLLLTNGAKPGKIVIQTPSGKDINISR